MTIPGKNVNNDAGPLLALSTDGVYIKPND
jgi:hypothetical protein